MLNARLPWRRCSDATHAERGATGLSLSPSIVAAQRQSSAASCRSARAVADDGVRGGAEHPGGLGSSNATLDASVPTPRPRRELVLGAVAVAAARRPAHGGGRRPGFDPQHAPGRRSTPAAARAPVACRWPPAGQAPPRGVGRWPPPRSRAAAAPPDLHPRSRPAGGRSRRGRCPRADSGAPPGLEPATAPGRRRRVRGRSRCGCAATTAAARARSWPGAPKHSQPSP